MSTTWLACLEETAKAAKNYGAEQHYFIQATKHFNYRKVYANDLRYQFFVDMAFGVRHFSYFTYRTSFWNDFDKSCVDNLISGKKYDTYDYAQQVNAEMSSFDHVYLSFDWNGTKTFVGTENPDGGNSSFEILKYSIETLDAIKNVSATQDTIIGQFKDKDNNDGLIITNYTDPLDNISSRVSLEFKNANRAIVYRNGEKVIYEVKDNKLKLDLEPGEGVFMIPVKIKL